MELSKWTVLYDCAVKDVPFFLTDKENNDRAYSVDAFFLAIDKYLKEHDSADPKGHKVMCVLPNRDAGREGYIAVKHPKSAKAIASFWPSDMDECVEIVEFMGLDWPICTEKTTNPPILFNNENAAEAYLKMFPDEFTAPQFHPVLLHDDNLEQLYSVSKLHDPGDLVHYSGLLFIANALRKAGNGHFHPNDIQKASILSDAVGYLTNDPDDVDLLKAIAQLLILTRSMVMDPMERLKPYLDAAVSKYTDDSNPMKGADPEHGTD